MSCLSRKSPNKSSRWKRFVCKSYKCPINVNKYVHQDNPDVKMNVAMAPSSRTIYFKDRGPVIPVDALTLVGVNQQSSGGVSGLIVHSRWTSRLHIQGH